MKREIYFSASLLLFIYAHPLRSMEAAEEARQGLSIEDTSGEGSLEQAISLGEFKQWLISRTFQSNDGHLVTFKSEEEQNQAYRFGALRDLASVSCDHETGQEAEAISLPASKSQLKQIRDLDERITVLVHKHAHGPLNQWKEAYEQERAKLSGDLQGITELVLLTRQLDIENPVLRLMVELACRDTLARPETLSSKIKNFVWQQRSTRQSPAVEPASNQVLAGWGMQAAHQGIVVPFGYCNLLAREGKSLECRRRNWRSPSETYEYGLDGLYVVDMKDKDLFDYDLSSIQRVTELDKCTAFTLANNNLTRVPEGILQLKQLVVLYVSGNCLTSIAPEIAQLINLKCLGLEKNKLRSLPPEIGALFALECLRVNSNELSDLPVSMSELSNLKVLTICINKFDQLPNCIAQLAALECVAVGENQLTDIRSLARLKQLKVLLAHDNLIKEIPAEIMQLKHLQEVMLCGNPLESVPMGLFKLPLKWLELEKGKPLIDKR